MKPKRRVCSKGKTFKKFLERKFTKLSNLRRRSLIYQYKKRGRILDLGCGSGSFLRQLDSKRWQRYGLDPYVSFKKDKIGVKFYSQDLYACQFPNQFFDVVTLWHVIEHVPDHKKLLKEIGRVMKSDGLLVISTPNLGGLGFKIAGKDWFHRDAPRHRFLFNLSSLKKDLDSSSFLTLKVNYPLLEYPLDLFHSVVRTKFKNKNLRMFLMPFLLPSLLVVRFFLSLIKKGETMEVICVKKRNIN